MTSVNEQSIELGQQQSSANLIPCNVPMGLSSPWPSSQSHEMLTFSSLS